MSVSRLAGPPQCGQVVLTQSVIWQAGFPVIGRFIRFHIRQAERELAFWKRHISTFVAVHNRDRFTPVALAGEHPVAQLEVKLAAADTLLLQIARIFFLASSTVRPFRMPELTRTPVAQSVNAALPHCRPEPLR